jgi:TonB family protein
MDAGGGRPLRRAAAALALGLLTCAAAAAQPEAPPVDAGPRGQSAAERMEEIRRRVQAAAEYPPIARERALAGEVQVAFRIGDDGRPGEIATQVSSGSAVLDRAAERAVADAAPLPRMRGRVVVPVRFVLHAPE